MTASNSQERKDSTATDIKLVPATMPVSMPAAPARLLDTLPSKLIDQLAAQVDTRMSLENNRAFSAFLNDHLLLFADALSCPCCKKLSVEDHYRVLSCNDIVCNACYYEKIQGSKNPKCPTCVATVDVQATGAKPGFTFVITNLLTIANVGYLTGDIKEESQVLHATETALNKDQDQLQAMVKVCKAVNLGIDEKRINRNVLAMDFANQVIAYAAQDAVKKENPYANLLALFASISKSDEPMQPTIQEGQQSLLKKFQLLFLNKKFADAAEGFQFFVQQTLLLDLMAKLVLQQLNLTILKYLAVPSSASVTLLKEAQTNRKLIESLQRELNKKLEEKTVSRDNRYEKFLNLLTKMQEFLSAKTFDESQQSTEYHIKSIFMRWVADYRRGDVPFLKQHHDFMTKLHEIFYNLEEELNGETAFQAFCAVENRGLLETMIKLCLASMSARTRLPLPPLKITQTSIPLSESLAALQAVAARRLYWDMRMRFGLNDVIKAGVCFSFEFRLTKKFVECFKSNLEEDKQYDFRSRTDSSWTIFAREKNKKPTADEKAKYYYSIKKGAGTLFEITKQVVPSTDNAATVTAVVTHSK